MNKAFPEVLDALVVDTDYGLGILRPKVKLNPIDLKVDEALFEEINHYGLKVHSFGLRLKVALYSIIKFESSLSSDFL